MYANTLFFFQSYTLFQLGIFTQMKIFPKKFHFLEP